MITIGFDGQDRMYSLEGRPYVGVLNELYDDVLRARGVREGTYGSDWFLLAADARAVVPMSVTTPEGWRPDDFSFWRLDYDALGVADGDRFEVVLTSVAEVGQRAVGDGDVVRWV